MKTTNSKLQEAGIKTLAITAAIFATTFTVGAQGTAFDNRFNDTEELASIETIKEVKTLSAKKEASADMAYFAELLEVENESELTVENWMTEAANFGVKELETEIEDVLKVEDWMIEEHLFDGKKEETTNVESGKVIVDKNGKTIGIVFPKAQFGRRTFILVEMEDEKLELEPWMVDSKIWVRN